MNRYAQDIAKSLTMRTKLEAIAEEASEVAQAAIKAIRLYGLNENPVRNAEGMVAESIIREEIMDLLTLYSLIWPVPSEDQLDNYWKWERLHGSLLDAGVIIPDGARFQNKEYLVKVEAEILVEADCMETACETAVADIQYAHELHVLNCAEVKSEDDDAAQY